MPTIPTRTIRRRPLMPHQGAAVRWPDEAERAHVAYLMEMRLGKTLTTVRRVQQWYAEERKRRNYPCLVLAPVTVLEAWEKELREEGEYFIVVQGLNTDKRTKALQEAFDTEGRVWVLLNYEALRATPRIADLPWMVVVLDESTLIKNPKAEISKICCEGFRSARHRLILTGLPSPESQLDVFQQFKFLDGHFGGFDNYYKFRNKYYDPAGLHGWEPKPGSKAAIKRLMHDNAFVLRRQDAGLRETKVRAVRRVQMTPDQKKAYKQVEKEFATWVQSQEHPDEEMLLETQYVIVQRLWMARMAGGCEADGAHRWDAKVRELVYLLKGELSEQPVVVWFRFNSEIHACASALSAAGIPYTTLTGDSSRSERTASTDWFRQSPLKSRVILVQVKLGKYGLDLSVADTAIYYSLSYSCEENAQSEERTYHPMKVSPLLSIYLITSSTVDEDVMYAVQQKITDARSFMTAMRDSFLTRTGTK